MTFTTKKNSSELIEAIWATRSLEITEGNLSDNYINTFTVPKGTNINTKVGIYVKVEGNKVIFNTFHCRYYFWEIFNAQVETELKNIIKGTKIKFEIDENTVYMSGLKNHFELDEENRLLFKTIQAVKIMDLVDSVGSDYYKFDDDCNSFVFDLHEEKENDED